MIDVRLTIKITLPHGGLNIKYVFYLKLNEKYPQRKSYPKATQVPIHNINGLC